MYASMLVKCAQPTFYSHSINNLNTQTRHPHNLTSGYNFLTTQCLDYAHVQIIVSQSLFNINVPIDLHVLIITLIGMKMCIFASRFIDEDELDCFNSQVRILSPIGE